MNNTIVLMNIVGSVEYITGWEKMQIKTSEYLAFIAIVAILTNLAWPMVFIYIMLLHFTHTGSDCYFDVNAATRLLRAPLSREK